LGAVWFHKGAATQIEIAVVATSYSVMKNAICLVGEQRVEATREERAEVTREQFCSRWSKHGITGTDSGANGYGDKNVETNSTLVSFIVRTSVPGARVRTPGPSYNTSPLPHGITHARTEQK